MLKKVILGVSALALAPAFVPQPAHAILVKYCFQGNCKLVRLATTFEQCLANQRCAGNNLGESQCNYHGAPWKGFIGTDPGWKYTCEPAPADAKTVWGIGFGAARSQQPNPTGAASR